jgi:hypothetical protein
MPCGKSKITACEAILNVCFWLEADIKIGCLFDLFVNPAHRLFAGSKSGVTRFATKALKVYAHHHRKTALCPSKRRRTLCGPE